jgi:RNA polymerase-binding transcription factor DksA
LTGEPIEAGRLQAIPWTRFSAAAQKELESKGMLCQTQLGELRQFTLADASKDSNEEDEKSAPTAPDERGGK